MKKFVLLGAFWQVGIALFFSATLLVRAESTIAKISLLEVRGDVSYSTDGSHFQSLHVGDFVKPGATVETGSGSTVDLMLPDSGTVLRLLPDSKLSFSRLQKQPAGEQIVSDSSLKLLKGSIIGSQRKLALPSHFDIVTRREVATIVGTEYIVNADGAVTVLDGAVTINYNLPGNQGSIKVTIPQGSTFDPASGTVVPTDPIYLQNVIADVTTVRQNAQTFKTGHATIVIKPEKYISPIKGNNGVGNGEDPPPPGNPPINDGPGTSPGNPGNQGGANN